LDGDVKSPLQRRRSTRVGVVLRAQFVADTSIEEKRDFSLHKLTASPFEPQGKQEVKREEKASACSVRNDGCGAEVGLLRSK